MECFQQGGPVDLEAVEMSIRSWTHQAGASMLGAFVESGSDRMPQQDLRCPNGHPVRFAGHRHKQLLTVLGALSIRRRYYHCDECQCGVIPLDAALDVTGTSFSPGVRRLMAHVGGKESFDRGREDLEILAGIQVETKQVERVAEATGVEIECLAVAEQSAAFAGLLSSASTPNVLYIAIDGTGVPMRNQETEGRIGKVSDQARTREAKLGCVFTQSRLDESGSPMRDPESTTYTGAIESSEAFGRRIYAEAVRRGLDHAGTIVVLGDGAVWIRSIVEEHFPDAVQIVDLYHAREHLSALGKLLYSSNLGLMQRWIHSRIEQLDQGLIEDLVASLKRLHPTDPTASEQLRKEIAYFEINTPRMRYAEFRTRALFVGSGVIEAGCRTIIGQRLKNSGMHWSVRGANAIIHLRCCQLSNRFDQFWEHRACA